MWEEKTTTRAISADIRGVGKAEIMIVLLLPIVDSIILLAIDNN